MGPINEQPLNEEIGKLKINTMKTQLNSYEKINTVPTISHGSYCHPGNVNAS